MKSVLFIGFFIVFYSVAHAQSNALNITGTVYAINKQSTIAGATILLKENNKQTISNSNGFFKLSYLVPGNYTVLISALGYKNQIKEIYVKENKTINIDIYLEQKTDVLDEVIVVGKSKATLIKETGYNVDIVLAKNLQNSDQNINQLSNQLAGIRVRESGGLGSSFSYSLNGMSGRSVRFFVDDVPVSRLGSGYTVNNIPINLIERIELYKGVVPPRFGSDALGGVVNVITKQGHNSYLDVSQSYGSFNTHKSALSGRWINKSKTFVVDAKGYYNYSDNNYFVWGEGVEVADPETGRAIEIKTRRFHDAYESYSGKLELAVQNKNWTDALKLNLLYAKYDNEIQHGATMSDVYGEATENEYSYSGSIQYKKKNLIKNLDISSYNSYSVFENKVIDTSSRRYNWLGEIIDVQETNSEIGSGQEGKSLLNLKTTNYFSQNNISYNLSQGQKFNFNYTFDSSRRKGDDPFSSDRTASFIAPQNLTKNIGSIAHTAQPFNPKYESTLWVKYYHYTASTVEENYVSDSEQAFVLVTNPIEINQNKLGYGLALKYKISNDQILKFSFERAIRIPDAEELLGNGLFVKVNPDLKVEESYNVNLGWLASKIAVGNKGSLFVESSLFYRNVSNLIQYVVKETVGTGQFENYDKVYGLGGTLDVKYNYSSWLQTFGNVTYQRMTDGKKYINNNSNITYKDLLPNTPYLMANAGVNLKLNAVFKKQTDFLFFWNVQYVHEFYLRWPSLGSTNKATIPTQLTHNTGVSYALKSGTYNISLGCNNIFNQQTYDNYLLQKPGRFVSLKLRYLIKNI